MNTRYTFFALCLLVSLTLVMPSAKADKTIVGQIENIAIGKTKSMFIAKIDTGAENSSLHANHLKLYLSKGQQWVSFRSRSKDGKVIRFKKKVKRMAVIKRKSAPVQERPVVELALCMGNVRKIVEVNLVDRGNFEYAVLVGRSYLSGNFIVDVDRSFSSVPNCKP